MGFIWGFVFGAFFGAGVGVVIISLIAGGRIQDILADMHNPANVSKRVERRK